MFSCFHILPQTVSHPLSCLSGRTQHDSGCKKENSEDKGNPKIASKPLHPVGSHLRSSGRSGQGFPQYCSLRRTIFFLVENLSSHEQVELQLPHSPSLQSTEKRVLKDGAWHRSDRIFSHTYLDNGLCCSSFSPPALMDMDSPRSFVPE